MEIVSIADSDDVLNASLSFPHIYIGWQKSVIEQDFGSLVAPSYILKKAKLLEVRMRGGLQVLRYGAHNCQPLLSVQQQSSPAAVEEARGSEGSEKKDCRC